MNELIFSMLVSFVLSAFVAGVYYKVNKSISNDDMILTILLLPVVVCAIIFTIGENIAGAFSLAGIFTIVRFRSTQASPKDITYILIAVAAGLTSATNFYFEGATLVVFSVIIILVYEKFKVNKDNQILKVLIPESLMNSEDIEEVLKKYSQRYSLEEIRTKDLGSLFELVYAINMSQDVNAKEMIDELRIINGNLTIKLSKGQ